jgi:hypothetical protein
MIRGIVIPTLGRPYVIEYLEVEPLYREVGETVGGWLETIPIELHMPVEGLMMVGNEEARLKDLPYNPLASFLYGAFVHGSPVHGNVVILKRGYRNGELDIVGLEEQELQRTLSKLIALVEFCTSE